MSHLDNEGTPFVSNKTNYPSVKIAIVGAGIYAREIHFPVLIHLAKNGKIIISEVWSRGKESSEKLAKMYSEALSMKIKATFGQPALEKLYQSNEYIDAAVIALPIPVQAQTTSNFLKNKIHAFQEKPIAGNYKEALELARVAKESYVMCGIGENYRIDSAYRKASDLIMDDSINFGDILEIQYTAFVHLPPDHKYSKTPWRHTGEHTGGMLLDGGVHWLAAMRLLAQNSPVKTINARCSRKTTHLSTADSLTSFIEFKNGINGTLHISFAGGISKNEVRVLGRNGLLTVVRGCAKDAPFGPYASRITLEQINKDPMVEYIPFDGCAVEFDDFFTIVSKVNDGENLSTRITEWDSYGRLCTGEALYDLSLVETMMESSAKNGESIQPKLYRSF